MQAESERLMTKYSYYKFNLDGFVWRRLLRTVRYL
jgi:hypothetical protein